MTGPAATLEAILVAENAALERHDAETAVKFLEAKGAAARALSSQIIDHDTGKRLRDLSDRNQLLLERALDVQSQIVSMVVMAAKAVSVGPRYGAVGNAIPGDSRNALTRHA